MEQDISGDLRYIVAEHIPEQAQPLPFVTDAVYPRLGRIRTGRADHRHVGNGVITGLILGIDGDGIGLTVDLHIIELLHRRCRCRNRRDGQLLGRLTGN